MAKHIVLTGASGFIGERLVPQLLDAGFDLTALARNKANVSDSVSVESCDLLDPASVRAALPKSDVIIHLASRVQVSDSIKNPALHLSENPRMLLSILETLHGRNEKPLIVFASTDRQYGHHSEAIDETASTFPIEPYSGSKMICEVLLETYQNLSDIPFIILRIDSVYGAGQPRGMFISDVIEKMLAGTSIKVGSLDTHKCFVHVDDVAQAFFLAAGSGEDAWNSVYNIGGEKASLKEIFNKLAVIIEEKNGNKVSVEIDNSITRKSAHEVGPFTLLTNHAQEKLGWEPRIQLDEGLRETVESFM